MTEDQTESNKTSDEVSVTEEEHLVQAGNPNVTTEVRERTIPEESDEVNVKQEPDTESDPEADDTNPVLEQNQPLSAPTQENFSHEVVTTSVTPTTDPQLDNTVYLPDLQQVQLELHSAAREGRDPNLDQFPRGAVVAAGVKIDEDGNYQSNFNDNFNNTTQNQPLNPEVSGSQTPIVNQSGQINGPREQVTEPYVQPEAEREADERRAEAVEEQREENVISDYVNPDAYDKEPTSEPKDTVDQQVSLDQVENAAAIERNNGVPDSAFNAIGQTDAEGNLLDMYGASAPSPSQASEARQIRPGAPTNESVVSDEGTVDNNHQEQVTTTNVVDDSSDPSSDSTSDLHSESGSGSETPVTEPTPNVHPEGDGGPNDLSPANHEVMSQSQNADGTKTFKVTKD